MATDAGRRRPHGAGVEEARDSSAEESEAIEVNDARHVYTRIEQGVEASHPSGVERSCMHSRNGVGTGSA